MDHYTVDTALQSCALCTPGDAVRQDQRLEPTLGGRRTFYFYARADNKRDKYFIMLEARLESLYPKKKNKKKKKKKESAEAQEPPYEIVDTFTGETLKGTRYKPLFEYFVGVSLPALFGAVDTLQMEYCCRAAQ